MRREVYVESGRTRRGPDVYQGLRFGSTPKEPGRYGPRQTDRQTLLGGDQNDQPKKSSQSSTGFVPHPSLQMPLVRGTETTIPGASREGQWDKDVS